MTKVTIYKNELNECVGFKACGHAGFDEEGYDIVCAAVSILTINTINSIDTYTDDAFDVSSDEDEGVIECAIKNPSKEATLLLNAMILGLQDVAKNYENYIVLKFEEV